MTMPSFDAVKGGKTHTVGSYEFHINFEHNTCRMEWHELSGMQNRAFSEDFPFADMKTVWDTLSTSITKGMTAAQLKTALSTLHKELLFTIDGITKP